MSPITINPPSPNPWVPHINFLIPAVNNYNDAAKGCLLGIPPKIFGRRRRHCLHLLLIIHNHIVTHLPDNDLGYHMSIWDDFTKFIGLRSSYLSSYNQQKLRIRSYFICCFNAAAWKTFLAAANAAGPLKIYGCQALISAWPTGLQRDTIITKSEKQRRDM
jgi:hypothetical protein